MDADAELMSAVVQTRLATTLGPAFLGFACTCVLYGITSLQTWMYFDYDFKEERTLRSTVLLLWFLDTLHILFLTFTIYRYVVVDFGDFAAILKPAWSLAAMLMVVIISNLIVRAIFGMRIWRLSGGHWFVPVVLVNVLSLFVLADGIYFAVRGLEVSSMLQWQDFAWSFYAGFSGEVIADTIIAVSQCMLLIRMKTGFEKTDSLVSLMMRYSINTGLLTSVCAACVLISYTAQPDTFIYMAFYFVYSKLYVNSLLATLNARRTRLMRQSSAVAQRIELTDSGTASDTDYKARDLESAQLGELTTIIDVGSRLAVSTCENQRE
ncbi:hypothetical protein C8Q77DRAFT_159503 [Trametes polyzona]|nr:hypothetical protein C8Q77DRAFT_159503 [Trametes polyzona]